MKSEPPDESAYGRVTNPGRFQPVVAAALALIDELVLEYEVERTIGISGVDFPHWHDPKLETIRLIPRRGVPIVFLVTPFPGVVIRFGQWSDRNGFPSCGCDACDESPEELVRELRSHVEVAVVGDYREELTKRSLGFELTWPGGRRSSSTQRLRRGEWKQYGQPGAHQWPPWPRRS